MPQLLAGFKQDMVHVQFVTACILYRELCEAVEHARVGAKEKINILSSLQHILTTTV
jgi:hypothetical protein